MSDVADKDRGPDDPSPRGDVSQGPSGLLNAETSVGGADAVPSTPDNVPAEEDGPTRPSAPA